MKHRLHQPNDVLVQPMVYTNPADTWRVCRDSTLERTNDMTSMNNRKARCSAQECVEYRRTNRNAEHAPGCNIRLGVAHAFLVTFDFTSQDGVVKRIMVPFAVSADEAKRKACHEMCVPTNEMDKFVTRVVQCKGGPSTTPVNQFENMLAVLDLSNPVMRTEP